MIQASSEPVDGREEIGSRRGILSSAVDVAHLKPLLTRFCGIGTKATAASLPKAKSGGI